jgi:TM2 domain-containing membrane protein YozV
MSTKEWNPGTAAVLSLLFPGAGQIYKGRIGVGLSWLVCVVAGYMMLVFPGIILHIICVYKAYSGNPYEKEADAPLAPLLIVVVVLVALVGLYLIGKAS